MRKKDKKIDVTLEEVTLTLQGQALDGLKLALGSKTIGELIETDNGFSQIEEGNVTQQYKTLDQAITAILEKYHLNH
ncbi:DUF2969 family protein [Streptococcus sp. DD12]|uniref:DUF2969 family protein n=1 Tax=Streptococcus sp. DD12 TaxID=1777880 RepID=UPI000796AD3C|nr:DUF2969 family protein [Streptococcus sp. DD12]KXT76681.1 hypothetical protein STRDD12_00319 [Streptococcus sp. DD12]